MASTEETMPAVAGAGLPGVSITSRTIRHFMVTDRLGDPVEEPTDPAEHLGPFVGRGFGRLAAACLDALFELAGHWRPDIVIGGFFSFAAPLLAARLGVPHVRHTWDTGEPLIVDHYAAAELAPELERLGLDGIPETDLWIEICPASVRAADTPQAAQPMRYVPWNPQPAGPLEPWMYTRCDRPRVLVTAGTKVSRERYFDYLCELAEKVKALGAEVVVGAPQAVAAEVSAKVGVWAGWLPNDVVVRTCDLVVNHGAGTVLVGMAAGVPQLLIPNMPKLVAPSQRLADFGAAKMLPRGEDTPAAVLRAGHELLAEPGYRERAREIATEMAAMPLPAEVLGVIEKLL
ncbi:glycosyltransferase [Kutzneria sp. CA-103260]|uniref:glycosyltransferase n=1 Tax=Kutzneria sp. CA-103260 TaxID=2802641 RepID=UPI001BA9F9A7|nr:glycosyltransferase [Kutzneria sp. CA-103260]QUQ64451.1 dNTP-hexose glycosyl transferase [Kutzneria sp. CA-103260]